MGSTTNYSWTLPDVGDSTPGWVNAWNQVFEDIDAVLIAEHKTTGKHDSITADALTLNGTDDVVKKDTTQCYWFVPCDKDSDGDMDPLIDSTNWNKAKSAGTGTIDWNADFGVPSDAKAVCVRVRLSPLGVGARTGLFLKAKSTGSNYALGVDSSLYASPADAVEGQGIVPIASNGTSYYVINDDAAATVHITIYVVGYYI